MKFVLIILMVILLLVGFMFFDNNKVPSGLGVKNGVMKPLSSKPNGVSSQAKDDDKYVEALPFVHDIKTTKAEIKAACRQYGESKIITETDNYIHLVFTTGKMKYHDDVELYFDTKNKVVHYRSESRIGYSDMGLNKARYDEISSNYKQVKEAK